MSESDKEISRVGGSVDDGVEDEQEVGGGDGGGGVHGNDEGKKQRLVGSSNFRKAKQVVLFPLAKARKQLCNTRQRPQIKRLSAASGAANAGSSGKRFGGTGSKSCYFCFTQPQSLDSPAESPTSDPNDPAFSYEMLKSLIEKNDFYSKECNPHKDLHEERTLDSC